MQGARTSLTDTARALVPCRGRWVRLAVLFVVLAAFAVQVTTLTRQSMWLDEVMALYFTRGSLTETLQRIVQPDDNGPLFYLLLFVWRRVAGVSDFAVRYMSVLFAVLTVPLLFRWVRRLLTDRSAFAAVWLFVCSPFVLWYAQEAKMYALHMMVSVASSLVLLEAFRKGSWWRWGLYVVLVSTVLYSHLFGAFLVASQGLMALLLGWRRPRRLLAYIASMLLLGVAHLPLLSFAWRMVRHYRPRDIWRGFVPLHTIIRDAIGQYFFRVPAPGVSWTVLLLPTGLILAGALLLYLRRRTDGGVLVLHAMVPVLIFYPVSFSVPVYTAKYLAAVVPALFALAAWGAEALARLWRPLGLLVLVLGMLMLNAVARDMTDPAMQRGDWRYVADYVETHEGGDDIVVISAYYVRQAFERYYTGTSDILGFGENPYDPLPFYARQAEEYDHLWLVLNQDQDMAPGHQLREAAALAFPVMTEQYPNVGQIVLVGYQMRFEYPALPAPAQPLEACFDNGLCLVGYWLDATSLPATEQLSHPPSNWIHAVLYWRRVAPGDGVPFRPLVRLVDADFGVWGGNMDRRPDLFDHYPPDDWPLDGVIETHFDLNLNPITPPGLYRLEVSLAIEGDEGRRVALVDGAPGIPADRFLFEQIQIEPAR